MDETADRASNGGMRNAFIQADLTARAISFVTREAINSTQELLQFGKELANLDTLLDKEDSLSRYRDGLLDLDPALGHTSELARGMYQAISSGVDKSEALDAIAISAKAARAGLASTFETVDMGTSIMASFNLQGKDLPAIYDKAFETVKRGKVEFPQLAQSIGLVSNIAAQAGISLDEMFAAIATSSRTNRPTVAIEGMRSAISNILQPSSEAQKLAKELGIEFDAQALKAKGLAGFLNEVSEATGGDVEKMATLFGNVQGLSFVMSVTGNQAKTFANDLKGVASASGTIEEAFQKQKESLSAQAEEAKIAIERGLIKTFLFAEPLLTGILKLVNTYPAIFLVATSVVIGLAAAHAIWNTELFLTAATRLPQLIASLQNTIRVMFAFNQVSLLSAQGATAFMTGWGIVAVAAIGLLIYAIKSYESAADRANKITLEQINTQGKAFAQNKETAQELQTLSAAQSISAEQHERLNAILGRLDPTTQAYINSLKDEKERVAALSGVIKDNLRVNQIELEATLRLTAKAIIDQSESVEDYNRAIKDSEAIIQRANQALAQGKETFELEAGVTVYATQQIDRHSERIVSLTGKKSELNKQLAANIEKNLQATQALGYNREALTKFYDSTLDASDQQKLFSLTIDKTTQAANENKDAVKDNTGAVKDNAQAWREATIQMHNYANQKVEFRLPEGDVKTTDAGLIELGKRLSENLSTATNNGRNYNEVLRELLPQIQAVNSAAKSGALNQADYARRIALLPAEVQKAIRDAASIGQNVKAIGEQATKTADPVKELTKEVDTLTAKVEALKKGPTDGGELFKLLIKKEDLENEKQELEDILKLRRALNFNQSLVLPQDQAGRSDELRTLQDFKKSLEDIKNLRRELGISKDPVLPTTPEEAAKLAAQLQSTKKATEEANNMLKDAQKSIAELNATSGEGFNHRQALEFWLKNLGDDAKVDAVLITNLRVAMQQWDKAQQDAASRREYQETIKSINQSVSELGRNLQKNMRDFAQIAEKSEVQKLLESFLDMKELQLPVNAFDPLMDFLKTVDLSDPKKLSALSDEIYKILWATGTFGDDVDTVRKISNSIASLLKASQEFDAQLTPVQRERNQLDREFQNLQNEIAVVSGTAALRYRNAWQQAINDVVLADQYARESMIISQVKLADAMVFHSDQLRARVMEHFAGQKSLTDSFADSFVSLADRAGDAVERALGKVDKLFGNIFSNLARLAINRIFIRILDAIFPQSGGQGAFASGAPSSSGGGGGFFGNLFSSIFRPQGGGASLTGGFSGGNPAAAILSGLGLPGLSSGSGITAPTSLTEQANQWSQISQIAQLAAPTAANAGASSLFSLGGLTGSLAMAAPFLGLSLGAGLVGGGSGLGGILGGIGGLLAGGTVGAFLAPGLFGLGAHAVGAAGSLTGIFSSLGAFLTNPFTIAAAGALLIGAYFLNRNAQRRKNETARAQLNSDTYSRIIDVLNRTTRGELSLNDAMGEWGKIKSDYFASIAHYDSKTKRIATDVWYGQGGFEQSYLPLIQKAAKDAEEAKKRDDLLEPEFNMGGYVARRFADGGTYHSQLVSQLLPMRPLGLTPGPYSRSDQYTARFTGNEVILNPEQWMPLTPLLSALNVPGFENAPGFADGGAQPNVTLPPLPSASSSSEKEGDINITLVQEFNGEKFVLRVMESPNGRKVTLNTMGSYEGRKVTANNNTANQGKKGF
ncbi:MAG: phage tail tape measure protein [Pyrinomonadaceae bacterium]|nr:phage tail tape measure protein [Pyrinomonadaceae bacterium]